MTKTISTMIRVVSGPGHVIEDGVPLLKKHRKLKKSKPDNGNGKDEKPKNKP